MTSTNWSRELRSQTDYLRTQSNRLDLFWQIKIFRMPFIITSLCTYDRIIKHQFIEINVWCATITNLCRGIKMCVQWDTEVAKIFLR